MFWALNLYAEFEFGASLAGVTKELMTVLTIILVKAAITYRTLRKGKPHYFITCRELYGVVSFHKPMIL